MEEKKLVPKRRFRAFEDGWKDRNFEFLADIVRGASPRPIEDSKWFDSNSNIGWLRISDVTSQNGRITYLEQRISELGQQKTRVVKNSHLLLSIAATVGKPVINYVKTGVHDGFLIFLNPKFDIEYMYQWLEMFRPKWQQYGQPGSQVNLNSDIVKKHILFIPKIEEQQKIGEFFKVLDKRIANQERKITKVKALKSAYLTEMFPQEGETVPKRRFKGFEGKWERFKLEDLAEIRTGYAFSSNQFKSNGKYLVITNKNIEDQDRGINTTSERIDINDEDIIQKYKLDNFNVLVSMDGDVGKTGKYTDENAVLAQRVGRLNSDRIDFIYQVTKAKDFRKTMEKNSVGNIIQHISLKQIAEYSFYAPTSKKEQQKIGELFKNLDDQITSEERKLEKLKKMKEAYLEEMFV